MKRFDLFLILLLLCFSMACNRGGGSIDVVQHQDTIAPNPGTQAQNLNTIAQQPDTAAQLKEVKTFLIKLKTAIATNDKPALLNRIHFPMQTQLMWRNDEQSAQEIDPKNGLITKEEFLKYNGKELFDKEQQRVLGYELGDDVSAINLQTDQASNYYKSLISETDPGTTLFNYYLQWERPDGRGDYWFGLVIGKIKGEFKVLSYYSKWPLKD